MDTTKDAVFRALRQVNYPGYSRDIVSFGLVHGVLMEGTTARIGLVIGHLDDSLQKEFAGSAAKAALAVPGVDDVMLQTGQPPRSQQKRNETPAPKRIPEVEHVVAVASGKGGVGKSTIAVNLATALSTVGYRVGLLDADIHGPNIPRMLGQDRLPPGENGKLAPAVAHGVKVISLAFTGPDQSPAIWRGAMIDKAIQQFTFGVAWGQLDLMVVDLPPGTGDAQLSLAQRVPLDGAVVVSTPQEVPLETRVRAGGDRGLPAVLMPDSSVGAALRLAAVTLTGRLGIAWPKALQRES